MKVSRQTETQLQRPSKEARHRQPEATEEALRLLVSWSRPQTELCEHGEASGTLVIHRTQLLLEDSAPVDTLSTTTLLSPKSCFVHRGTSTRAALKTVGQEPTPHTAPAGTPGGPTPSGTPPMGRLIGTPRAFCGGQFVFLFPTS